MNWQKKIQMTSTKKVFIELNTAGLEISMDDLKEPSGELSEDELKAVAGATNWSGNYF